MLKHKMFILLICGILLISAIVVYMIQNGNQATSRQNKITGPAGRTGRPLTPSEISSNKAYKDRKAMEAYEKRNAEIDSWIKDDEIPDHNNAALLYYQALLLRPDHDQTILNKIYDVYGGAEPDTQTKVFLGHWLPTMQMSEIGSRIPQCTWGAWSEPQINAHFLNAEIRPLCFVSAVDAITLASDGHYKAALERCMTLRRIARHFSYDSKLHLSSSACDNVALRTIREILGDMPLDADMLTWLQDRLTQFQEAMPFLDGILHKYLKAEINRVKSSSIVKLRGMLLKIADGEQEKENIRNLTDEQIRLRIIQAVQGHFDSFFAILHSDKSAKQKRIEIEALTSYTPNMDIIMSLKNISDESGEEIARLITGMGNEMTEEQKLFEMQKIIDKSAEPNMIELLTKFSDALGKELDFGFIADSEITNEQKLSEMQKVINEMVEACAFETFTFGVPGGGGVIDRLFESQVEHEAHIKGIKAAVTVYLVLAKTGKLPMELPDGLPKDPYSDKDFGYETTDDGFALRCQVDDQRKKEQLLRWLTFKVQK